MADISKIIIPNGTEYAIKDTTARSASAAMTGATSQSAGTGGTVPIPAAGYQDKFLRADGTWADGGHPMAVLTYGTSTWQEFIDAYNGHYIVYCRTGGRMAFMAYVNKDGVNPTEVEFQYYRSVNSKSNTQQGDETYIYKLTNANGGTWTTTTRQNYTKIVAGTNATSSYSNGTLTLNVTPMTGATISAAGSSGAVPKPTANDYSKFLRGNGTWSNVVDGLVVTNSISMGRKMGTTAGTNSTALGASVEASGIYSHAEGNDTKASGSYSHSEGYKTTASGSLGSHSEGYKTTASATSAHAEGNETIANHRAQHVFGEFNESDSSSASNTLRGNYVEIVGNGTADDARSNARTLDWDGNEWLAGDLTVGGTRSVMGMVLTPSAPIAIPSTANSPISLNLEGLTADHTVVAWRFSASAENSPPCDLTITTYDGYFTVSNTSGTTIETIQPVFAIPNAVATTTHNE